MNSSCPNCGGTFTPAEYNAPSCKYCGKVLPNYAEVQQKVAQVQALMADSDGSGIPNALKGMVGAYSPFPGGAPYAGPPVQGMPQPYGPGAAVPVIIAQTQRSIRNLILLGVLVPLIIVLFVGGVITFVALRAVPSPTPATHAGRH